MKGKVALAVALAAVIVAPACSSNTPSSTPSATQTPGVVKVVEKEWSITPLDGTFTGLTAGNITFEAHNEGTMNHEFVLVKTDLAADKLPVKDAKVDEDKLTGIVGEIEEFAAGKVETKAFDLTAGSYVAFCNVVGHYQQGMHAAITVV